MFYLQGLVDALMARVVDLETVICPNEHDFEPDGSVLDKDGTKYDILRCKKCHKVVFPKVGDADVRQTAPTEGRKQPTA